MGYYSKVYLAVPTSTYDEIVKQAGKIKFREEKDENCRYSRLLDCVTVTTQVGSDVTLMYWDDVKWYDGWEEVKIILQNAKKGLYAFLRIGEDVNDVEYEFECIDSNVILHSEFEAPFEIRTFVEYDKLFS